MTIALYYWRGANYERCLADIDTRLQHHGCAAGERTKFPAYTAYAERLCSRPGVQQALSVKGISMWE
jgi:glutathione S-transferase